MLGRRKGLVVRRPDSAIHRIVIFQPLQKCLKSYKITDIWTSQLIERNFKACLHLRFLLRFLRRLFEISNVNTLRFWLQLWCDNTAIAAIFPFYWLVNWAKFSILDSSLLLPNEQNFDLDNSRHKFHSSLKEHHKISNIFRSFVAKCCKMRIIAI
jgi:hypothetical protein